LEDTLCGLTFRLSVPSFYQINRDQAEVLYGKAVEYAGLTGKETVLDLYCGTGTITLAMSKAAGKVIGAEIVPEAIEDAKKNAERNGVENASFFCGDANHPALSDADIILVDPPRKGLESELIAQIARINPRKVVYISCNPATLARDLALFQENGYTAGDVQPVNLFPRTAHCECVVCLTRRLDVDMRR
jgi:23S rRNA (uracil1939-C5)-methyltransferase